MLGDEAFQQLDNDLRSLPFEDDVAIEEAISQAIVNMDGVKRALENGADPDSWRNFGASLEAEYRYWSDASLAYPLSIAVRIGNYELIDLLLSLDIERKTEKDRSPLWYAVDCGNYKLAQWLLDRGAHVHNLGVIEALVDGRRACLNFLKLLIKYGLRIRNQEVTNYLIERLVESLDELQEDTSDESPLIFDQHIEMLKWLIDLGARCTKEDPYFCEMFEYFQNIAREASLKSSLPKDSLSPKKLNTLLIIAAAQGKVSIIESLADKFKSVLGDRAKDQAFARATLMGQLESLQALRVLIPDNRLIELINQNLETAAVQGYTDIVNYFISVAQDLKAYIGTKLLEINNFLSVLLRNPNLDQEIRNKHLEMQQLLWNCFFNSTNAIVNNPTRPTHFRHIMRELHEPIMRFAFYGKKS